MTLLGTVYKGSTYALRRQLLVRDGCQRDEPGTGGMNVPADRVGLDRHRRTEEAYSKPF